MSAQSQTHKTSTNRKALRDFFITDRIEAGIALCGTEVKSIRDGQINLTGSYAQIDGHNVTLTGAEIAPYKCGNQFNHISNRPRRLLLNRREIIKLTAQIQQKGMTLVPLSCYFKHGRVKIELGVGRGRQDPDKRDLIRTRDADRDARREMSRR
jgi:SsrA-binding protein